MAMQRPSAVRERWWTGLNFTFQTNGPAKGPLLCSKDWPKLTTILNWLKAWRAHGDENKSLLSSVKCSTSRALECNGLFTTVIDGRTFYHRCYDPNTGRNSVRTPPT